MTASFFKTDDDQPDPALDKQAERLVRKARGAMLSTHTFFAELSLGLQLAPKPGLAAGGKHAPMACDGTTLFFDPVPLIEENNPDYMRSRVALHALRCMRGHPFRRHGRDQGYWDMAGELSATPDLVAAGFKLAPDMLYDEQWAGHSVEQVFQQIWVPKPPGSPGGEEGQQPAQGGGSSITDAPKEPDKTFDNTPDAPPPEPPPRTEFDWAVAGYLAEMAQNKAEDTPGAENQLLDDLRRSRFQWYVLMRRFFRKTARTRLDWSRPQRRYAHAGLYLPSKKGKKLGRVIFIVDSSGSVWKQMDRFQRAFNGLVADTRPEEVFILYWDVTYQGHQTFHKGEELTFQMQAKGGGGTNFRQTFKWLQDHHIEGVACVFVTDLDAHFPTEPPVMPVIWAVTGARRKAPFGEVVCIDDEP